MKHPVNRRFLRIFLALFCFFAILAAIFQYYIYESQRKQLIRRITEYYSEYLVNRAELIRAFIMPAIFDLNYLSRQRSVIEYLDDPRNSAQLIADMRLFAQHNWNYKQVRFIDHEGMEKIRINWEGDSLLVIPDSLLQDKSRRPYFQETMNMQPGSVYISPVDLNIEHGQIEIPFQRVIRFSTPVAADSGELTGIIVINRYLNDFFETYLHKDIHQRDNFHFLDKDGYWLQGPDRFPEYGFQFDSLADQRFETYYPEFWKKIKAHDFGEVEYGSKLCFYRHVRISSRLENNDSNKIGDDQFDPQKDWIIAYVLDMKQISELNSLKRSALIIGLIVGLLVLIVSYVITTLRFREIRYIRDLNRLNLTLEQRIKERTKELSYKNSELAVSNEELEAFSYSVSHDLRAPLRHISGFVDLLIKRHGNELSGKGITYLGYVRDASMQMARLIDDLLKFSRLGRSHTTGINFKMEELVDDCIQRIERDFPGRDIRWQVSSLPEVTGDYNLLSNVWINLLGNAVKYSSKKEFSLVEISCYEEEGSYIFSVKDNGIGFEDEYSHKLFGPFQRLHAMDEYEGSGIGLAIVRRIVIRHGGQVWAHGKINEGAIFSFSLPINAD